MSLSRSKYKLFDSSDYQNIIGTNLESELYNEGSGNNSEYMSTYTSLFIINTIKERSGITLFVVKDTNSPNKEIFKFGYSEDRAITLPESIVEQIKLACVYQCDYFINNGSSERMSPITIGSGTYTLKSAALCDMANQILTCSGLFYTGRSGFLNAWFE